MCVWVFDYYFRVYFDVKSRTLDHDRFIYNSETKPHTMDKMQKQHC